MINPLSLTSTMNSTLQRAIAEASQIDDPAQEAIGREILRWIDERRVLRAELQIGIDELDAGLGRPLDVRAQLKKLHARYHQKRR
jgi:hypothetical protein